jgi:hypothetical protein
MAHAQKQDFVLRRNERVHLNGRGRQFSRLLAADVCASALVMLDTPSSEVVWRVLVTHSFRQFPLHFPTRASPCAITFQLDSTGNVAGTVWWYCQVWKHTLRQFCVLPCLKTSIVTENSQVECGYNTIDKNINCDILPLPVPWKAKLFRNCRSFSELRNTPLYDTGSHIVDYVVKLCTVQRDVAVTVQRHLTRNMQNKV